MKNLAVYDGKTEEERLEVGFLLLLLLLSSFTVTSTEDLTSTEGFDSLY